MTLLDLAAKVEAAEGPSFALDCEISKAVGSAAWPPRAYTASIDAAMMLVPEGFTVRLAIYPDGENVCILNDRPWEDEQEGYVFVTSVAATPALALTAAALRARSENPA
ncbi:hypothetical protein [Tardibacter chloracetimidivorans]|uniref:hypothetical protein n=1 Tax=Tardibacter chloracetimidivorans TaxID=1921510 RepID=UPI001D04B6C6|nr:hypothetical protein [Tardibacter chloracetimidivorans]